MVNATYGRWQILTAYAAQDPRIALIRNEKNIGLTKSLNKRLAREFVVEKFSIDNILKLELDLLYSLATGG